MDSAEVGKYIESVAVRIAFHNGNSVAGTGVLYTLQAQKRAVVLTAGHVLQSALPFCPFGAKTERRKFLWNWLIRKVMKQSIFTTVRALCTMAESIFLTLQSSRFLGTTG